MSNKLKKKSTLNDIKFRTGDLVREGKDGELGVVGCINGWWQLEHLIDVYFKDQGDEGQIGIGCLVDYRDLILVKKREDVKQWWTLISGLTKIK